MNWDEMCKIRGKHASFPSANEQIPPRGPAGLPAGLEVAREAPCAVEVAAVAEDLAASKIGKIGK